MTTNTPTTPRESCATVIAHTHLLLRDSAKKAAGRICRKKTHPAATYPDSLPQQACVETVIEALKQAGEQLADVWLNLVQQGAPAQCPNLAPEMATLAREWARLTELADELAGHEAVRCRKLGIPSRYRGDNPESVAA